MTEYTSSSIPTAEIKIAINNGLIIPITATLLEQDAEDPIFSIFCYTSNRDIKILLKINKSTIQSAFQGQDFFKSSQEGYLVAAYGKVLEKKDSYLSVLVSDITVASNNPVFISDELKDHLGIIVQGPTVSPYSAQQAIEELNMVEVQTEQHKSLYKNPSDNKMEISNILLDTSVNFNDDFDGFSDIQYAASDDTETIDLTQETNNTLQENTIDTDIIETAENTTLHNLTEGSEVVEEATVDIETDITGLLAVDTEIKSDQSSSPFEPIIVTDKYETSPQNQQFLPSRMFLNQPQLVDLVQATDMIKEPDQDTVSDLVREEGFRKDIIQDQSNQINPMSEENAQIHSMPREEIQDNSTQQESLKNNNIQGDIIRKGVMKESLQISITPEENSNNSPYQQAQVQLQEDGVESLLSFLPKVYQVLPDPENNVSPKMKVRRRRKIRTIIIDPKDLRRSPRLALKKSVRYFPIKRTRRTCKNITLS
ncbi:hypothetical protein INT48_008572 [Thamnidium elegans]|uniref:Uncharacterized protein n=1 Tax=Thamnidium elegans TaxID=101142 RepID=A0A8H7SWH8_9FUNG|nr:hypothetical protein INT48_008572 [Thamnidium elegans]